MLPYQFIPCKIKHWEATIRIADNRVVYLTAIRYTVARMTSPIEHVASKYKITNVFLYLQTKDPSCGFHTLMMSRG